MFGFTVSLTKLRYTTMILIKLNSQASPSIIDHEEESGRNGMSQANGCQVYCKILFLSFDIVLQKFPLFHCISNNWYMLFNTIYVAVFK